LRSIEKHFGSVVALAGVNFDVDAGEVVALVGDNGAGKSTLAKIISGAYPADDGAILFEGHAVRLSSPEAANRLGISAVYQDLALCEILTLLPTCSLAVSWALLRCLLRFGHLQRTRWSVRRGQYCKALP
jgi:ABC-type sugar transport system ATPase subunit